MNQIQIAAAASSLDDYGEVLGAAEISELRALADRLRGRSAQMINSTLVGGGVAEILNRMVPLMQELGLAVRWDAITGGEDFFAITKAFHNALHGESYKLPDESFKTFRDYNEQNQKRLDFGSDFTVIHDPQPAALIDARNSSGGHWIWRCHIDLSQPNRKVWSFLEPYVN